jgi:hypothetical protein
MSIIIGGNTLDANDLNPSGNTVNVPNVVTRDLVLWLDAGNNSSYINSSNYYDCGYGCMYYSSNPGCTNCNTQIKDMSGFGNDGTFNGGMGISQTAEGGGSMFFDGSNDNVTIPPASVPTGSQLTFCVWNYGIDSRASSVIECRDSTGNRTLNVHLPWANTSIYFDCGGDRLQQEATNANYQGWHHWCFTKNVSTGSMVIYLDGVAWASSTGNVGTIATTTAARIGSYAVDTTYHYGYVAVAQLYKRALSATEILQNYNNGRIRFGV